MPALAARSLRATRSLPWFAAVLVACAELSACAPRHDWREIRADEDHYLAMMPARPDRMTRPIDLDGMPVNMTMQGARIDGVVRRLGHWRNEGSEEQIVSVVRHG